MRDLPATALLVDLRDFTPTFQAYDNRGDLETFLGFLEEILRVTSRICAASFFDREPGELLYLNSTGDGVLAVFEAAPGQQHALRAWLAALRLVEKLPAVRIGNEPARFGIGIESGTVNRVGSGRLATRIGHCINHAARLEPLTKMFTGTQIILGESANRLLSAALADVDYEALVSATRTAHDPEQAWAALRAANDAIGVFWIGNLVLKGVSRSLHAFRGSPAVLAGSKLATMIVNVEARLR